MIYIYIYIIYIGEELPLLLKEMNETAANAIEGSELDTAVDCLQKSEQLLEVLLYTPINR